MENIHGDEGKVRRDTIRFVDEDMKDKEVPIGSSKFVGKYSVS